MTFTLLANGTVLMRAKDKSAMDVAGRLHRSPGAPLLEGTCRLRLLSNRVAYVVGPRIITRGGMCRYCVA